MQDIAFRCGGFRAPDCCCDAVGETIAATDHREPNAVANQAFDFAHEIKPQERHQRCDLRSRPAPIVAGEGVERQCSHALLWRGFHDAPDRFDAGFMAAQARQPPSGRPSSIAIHDDADMEPGLEPGGGITLHYKASFQKKDDDQAERMPSLPAWASCLPAALAASRTSRSSTAR